MAARYRNGIGLGVQAALFGGFVFLSETSPRPLLAALTGPGVWGHIMGLGSSLPSNQHSAHGARIMGTL